MRFRKALSAIAPLFIVSALTTRAMERHVLLGHVPSMKILPASRLDVTRRLNLAIGLPLRNRAALTNLLEHLYDPASGQFHHYLTPAEFTSQFGPSEAGYQAAVVFAVANGLVVSGTHPNRLILDVQGSVADIERAFHVQMNVYSHPREARTFFAPNVEPSIDANLSILHVSGLNNFTTPSPKDLRETDHSGPEPASARQGSGANGTFFGNDFRSAYVPGTALTGAGQVVGLFELGGYYAADIAAYETQAGIRQVPLENVHIDGFNGSPGSIGSNSPNEEVALDIEMATSIAPGLSKIIVYEGPPNATSATVNDVLNRMATDNLAKQLSCSWGFDIDLNSQEIFQEYAAQGQSFFLAAGDSGAFAGPVFQPSDDPFITVVGGTELTTDNSHAWVAESTWNGSSGGISTVYPIPGWQQGIDMSVNQGSTTMRNIPDVAMVADNIGAIADRGRTITLMGTSIAAPLWAGFTALVNQQAASQGKPPIGFLNPALYAIGKGPLSSGAFHDITTGDNTTPDSPDFYHASTGYDLCTGWGTPTGSSLINALLGFLEDSLVVNSPLGVTASGPVGGPFSVTQATYTLSNAGTTALDWSIVNTADWLGVTPSSGSLAPGGPAVTVTVSLKPSDTGLLIGTDQATLSFVNLNNGVAQDREFTLAVGNGDFETGDFSDWTVSADADSNFADSIDSVAETGTSSLPGVDDSLFAYEGIYGAFLGQANSLGFLSQSLPTVSGQRYVVSFWLDNPGEGTPNEFLASWNGDTLVDLTDTEVFAWTQLQYVVTATSAASILQFGFRNDQQAFGLDDVSVEPVVPPKTVTMTLNADSISLTWSGPDVVQYQVQYTEALEAGAWTDLVGPINPSEGSATVSDSLTQQAQRYYRVVVVR